MKAQEVLRRYAAGERNFCNANLRGANFKGQSLSGADFSGTDIRSANFADTVLQDVNFKSVRGGVRKRWVAIQFLLKFAVTELGGFLQSLAGAYVTFFFYSNTLTTAETVAGFVYLMLLLMFCGATLIQGFTVKTLFFSLSAVAFAFVFIVVFAVRAAVAIAVMAAVSMGVVAAYALIGAVAMIGRASSIVACIGTSIGALVIAPGFSTAPSGKFAVVLAGTILLSNIYIARQVVRENKKFAIIRVFGLWIESIGGTRFSGSNLLRASFAESCLSSTNFSENNYHKTNLAHVCWRGAENLEHARLGNSILQDRRVRILLTTPEKGYKQDLTDANLRGANLKGVTLEGAILRRAILTDALLKKAVLKDAILTEAQAINTDFTGACLTGATLEAWNIDSTTTLKNIDCEYVFLREIPDTKGNRDRLPHDSDRVFQSGDFEKLFKEVPDEVRILIRNGIDPIAFRSALQKIMVENPGITQNSVRTLDKKGQDVLMTLQVPEGVEKSKLEQDWHDGYQTGLQAGEEAIQIEREKFERLAFFDAKNPRTITIYKGNKIVTGNDQSQKIDVKGDFTITANQSVVSLRDISGQVNNQIAQLSDDPTQAQLKDLLTQLQSAIKAESALSEEDKAEALAEVKKIAEAGQSPQDGPMKNAAKRSLTFLKGMTVGLSETTKFVTACNGLLPAIALLFSL